MQRWGGKGTESRPPTRTANIKWNCKAMRERGQVMVKLKKEGGGLASRQTEWKRPYLPEQQRPLSQWKCRRDCDSEPWDWLLLSGSTARVQSLAYGPSLFFRVRRREREVGVGWVGEGVGGYIELLRRSWSRGTQGRQRGLRKRWTLRKRREQGGTKKRQVNETERQ